MKIESSTIRNVSIALLAITLAVCLLTVTRNVNATLVNANRAAETLADYTAKQTEQLQSEKNKKAIEAGIAAAASFQATANLINTKTIPQVNKTVEALAESAQSLNRLVSNLDTQVNQSLLPAAANTLHSASGTMETASQTVAKYGATADELNKTIANLNKESAETMASARALLNSEDIKKTLAGLGETSSNLAAVTKNVEAITANTAEASRQMPLIAADVQKFTSTTSKFRKLVIAAQLAGAISPFLRF